MELISAFTQAALEAGAAAFDSEAACGFLNFTVVSVQYA
jgi:hypothetical protein